MALRTASDEHPPFHYWLLSLWRPLAGESEFALRFSSLFFAVLTVALLIRIGSTLCDRRVGLVAGLLLSIAPFHIYWSQEIKMYAMAIFLSLLAVYLFICCFRKPSLRLQTAYVLATLAALHTLYLSFVVLALENAAFILATVLKGRYRWRWREWLLPQCSILLLALPWLYVYYTHSVTFKQAGPFDFGLFLRLYATVLPLGISTRIENYSVLALALLSVGTVGLLLSLRKGERSEKELVLVAGSVLFLFPLLLFALSSVGEAIFHAKVEARYFVILVPLYSLFLSLGIRAFWRCRPILGLLAFFFVLASLGYPLLGYFPERRRSYHLPALASYIAGHATSRAAVLLHSDKDWPVFSYYLDPSLPRYSLPYGLKLTAEEARRRIQPLTAQHDAIWLISTPQAAASDRRGAVSEWLGRDLRLVVARDYGRTKLSLYNRTGRLEPATSSDLVIQNRREVDAGALALLGYDSLPPRVSAREEVHLTSYWRVTSPVSAKYAVRIVMADEEGARYPGPFEDTIEPGEGDLQVGRIIQLQGRLPLAPLIPGRHRVELEVETAERSLAVPLGQISVDEPRLVEDGRWKPAKPSLAVLGDSVQLVGYEVSPDPVRPGGKLRVSLLWRARAEMVANYTVFVQLLDASGKLWLQSDSTPARGSSPTSTWSVDDLVKDEHDFTIPRDATAGVFGVIAGMYDFQTMKRLPVAQGEAAGRDAISLGQVQIDGSASPTRTEAFDLGGYLGELLGTLPMLLRRVIASPQSLPPG